MRVDQAFIDHMKYYFLPRKGDSTVGGTITPAANDTHNLGTPDKRFDTIYARQVVADSISGGTTSDTVDGFHAYAAPQADSLLALDSNSTYPTSVYPNALLVDGSRGLTGNLSVDAGITIDGVDISVHKAGTARTEHTAGLGTSLSVNATMTSSGSLEAGAQSIAVNTGHAFTWTAQHVFDAGLRLNDGDRINFGTNSDEYLYRYDANDIGIHGGLRSISPDWASENIGWHISYDGNADFRRIFADELHVRAFIADIEQALAGGQIISKSVAILWQDFKVPQNSSGPLYPETYLYIEDLPGFYGVQAFQSGDYVRLRRIDRSGGGLTVEDIWGSVSSYVDQGNGYQRWAFTRQQGSYDVWLNKGAIVIDYGTSGQGYWEVTTIDTQYSPYSQIVTWTTNPWAPANRTIRTRMGNLDGITDPDLTPTGWGLYSDNVYLSGEIIAVNGAVKILSDGIVINPGTGGWPASEHKIRWEGSNPDEQAWIGFGETISNDFWAYLYSIATASAGHKAHVDLGAFAPNYSMQLTLTGDDTGDYARADFKFNTNDFVLSIKNTEITFSKDFIPGAHNTYDIGTDVVRVANLYVETLHATNQNIGGNLTGQIWTYPGDMYIRPESASAHTVVYIVNSDGTYQADLNVERNIVLGGTVDGVDVSGFKSAYDIHAAWVDAHHYRSHSITSSSDHTVTGSTLDVVGLSSTNTLGILTPSSNPGAASAILKSTATGTLTLQGITINGDISVSGNVDGVDISFHASNADAHHGRSHAITSASDHTVTGSTLDIVGLTGTNTLGILTPSSNPGAASAVLKSTASGSLTLQAIAINGNITVTGTVDGIDISDHAANPNAHHNQVHAISGTDHTVTGSEMQVVGLTATDTIGLLTPSSNPGGASAILKSDTSGYLRLVSLGVGTEPVYPLHVSGATNPQVRIEYDAGYYADIDVSSGGNLSLKPYGNVIFEPVNGSSVLPSTGYRINIGNLDKKYLSLHASELWVETLVAQDTLATIGGRVLVGPTTTLIEDFLTGSDPDYIKVKHNNLGDATGEDGAIVYMEANGSIEFMQILVHDTPDSGKIWRTVTDGYEYRVDRDLDASGQNIWYAGDAVFNTGKTGNGWIDLYSYGSMKPGVSQSGPTIVGNVRTSTAYNAWVESWAIGNLDGLYGKGATTYGVGLGRYATDEYMVITSGGIEMFDETNARHFHLYNPGTGIELTLGSTSVGEYMVLSPSDGIHMWANGVDLVHVNPSGPTVRVGPIDSEKIEISSTAVQFKDNATIYGELSNSLWKLGVSTTEHIEISSTSIKFVDNTTVYTELTGGTLTLGYVSGGEYLSVTSSGIAFYGGGAQKGNISSSGTFWFGNTATNSSINWDGSYLRLYGGATEVFRIGTDGNANLIGAMTVTGYISAGNGNVLINQAGIRINAGTGSANQLIWYDAAESANSSYMYGYFTTTAATNDTANFRLYTPTNIKHPYGQQVFYVYSSGSTENTYIQLLGYYSNAYGNSTINYYANYHYFISATGSAVVYLNDVNTAIYEGGSNSIRLATNSGYVDIGPQNTSWCHFSTDRANFWFNKDVTVYEGLLVGESSAPSAAGNVEYTGQLKTKSSGAWLQGYIYIPLSTPLTNASWQGNAYSSVGTSTAINLNSSFGVPLNARAVNMSVTTRDSAAWGTNGLYIAIGPSSSYWYQFVNRPIGGDVQMDSSGIVNTYLSGTTPYIYYRISASGSSTMDIWIYIWGYFI